jgi:ABC-type transporter Mla subunit MlaD
MMVGGFVIVAMAALLWMVAQFGELPIAVSKHKSFEVVVQFPSAFGVRESTPVLFCGYQVGKVTHVRYPEETEDPQGNTYHQVKIHIGIEKKYKRIPDTAEFRLMKRSMGSSYIDIVVDPTVAAAGVLKSKMAVIQGIQGTPTDLIPLKVQQKLEMLLERASSLASNVDKIVGDEVNQNNIRTTLENTTVLTAQATETLKSIHKLSGLGQEKVQVLAEQISETLSDTRAFMAKFTEGNGSAAKLLNDGQLYENLLESTSELQMALDQLKRLAAEAREKGIKIKL